MATLRQRKDKDKDKLKQKEKLTEEESKGSETKKRSPDGKKKRSSKSKEVKEASNARIEKQRRVFAWISLFFSLWAIAVMLGFGYVAYEKHLENTRAQELKKVNDAATAQAQKAESTGGTKKQAEKQQPKEYHWPEGGILMTAEELAKHDGSGESCYLSILGEVYDVSSGEFYRASGGYEFFSGRDASRGFHTGTDGEDIGTIEGLKIGALSGIVGWTIFYQQHENYTYVGKLVGEYYDKEGNPTQAKLGAIEAYSKIQEMQELFDEERKDEPDCNRWWNRESQKTEVYCEDAMIHHREVTSQLVPRKKMHPIDDRLRCACIELDKAERDKITYIRYSTCRPSDNSCILLEGE